MAQNSFSIKGMLADSTHIHNQFENGNVLILRAKDSILIANTRATADGSFILKQLPAGNFILLITYPGYADYVDNFILGAPENTHNFNKIYLTNKIKLLAEVVIRAKSAVSVKNDTVEFHAENFVVQPNAKVEDLLKQLPGIEVDKGGNIRAQGQRINKVLVDGEEFFGDDPTLVTRNIRADMVDKIQLYDKKSEQATLTGVDDNKKNKTINVVLKEDSKEGYFGNANLGYASNKLYEGQTMFNIFRDHQKIAAYGTAATTGKTGPTFNEANRFGTVPTQTTSVTGVTGFFDELEGTGQYDGRGLPVARTSGVHYDDKWDTKKQSINGNYRIGSIETTGQENTIQQQILLQDITRTETQNLFKNNSFRQKADLSYEYDVSPESIIKINVDGTIKHVRNASDRSSERTLENGTPLTNENNKLSNDGKQKFYDIAVTWSKRFKKPGRALYLTINQSQEEKQLAGYQLTTNNFFNPLSGLTDSTATVDRYQLSTSRKLAVGSSLTYAEALSKTILAYLKYGINYDQNAFRRQTFDKSETDFNLPNTGLSNQLNYHQLVNQGSLILNYKKDKNTINAGINVTIVDFDQLDLYIDDHNEKRYINWNPQLNFQHRFSRQKTFRLNYIGTTTLPTIDQLRPIKITDDPLNIIVGNPNLKPSYSNRITLTFNDFKPLNNQNFDLTAYYVRKNNPFSFNYISNSAGVTNIQTINLVDRVFTETAMTAEISRILKHPAITIGLNVSTALNTNYDIINTVLNKKDYVNLTGGFRISKEKQKQYSLSFRFNTTYSRGKQSAQQLNDYMLTYYSATNLIIYLPGKTDFSSDILYTNITGNNNFGMGFHSTIINASMNKRFLKDENLRLSFSVNNLLNDNPGFVRRPNYQTVYTTIRRYMMLSLIWDFSKMGKQN